MPSLHAVLAPSAAGRWMNCPPSARLEETVPDRKTEFSMEGTMAHALGEYLLGFYKKARAEAVCDIVKEWNDANRCYDCTEDMPEVVRGLKAHEREVSAAGLDFLQMLETVHDGYVRPVWEAYLEARKKDSYADIFIETGLNLTEWIPEGFGTCDAAIISGKTLEIYDLKYGKGVRVEAKGNVQMRIYALGALREFGELFDIHDMRMTIVQPRLDSISSAGMNVHALLQWGNTELKAAALAAYSGQGDANAGDWCRFCKVHSTCKAARDKVASIVARSQDPRLMTPAETAEALREVPFIKTWLSGIEEYSLEMALAGTTYPGFKLVEGRSVRKYSDQNKCAEILHNAGFTDDVIYKPKELKGISDMEKILRKKAFNELLGQYVIKPAGKPSLVPEDDPREPLSTAENDFKEIYQSL